MDYAKQAWIQIKVWFSGVHLVPLDWDSDLFRFNVDRRTIWMHKCEDMGVPHSKYWRQVYAQARQDKVVVVSQAAGGNFIKTLSLTDGKQIARHKP